MQCDKSIHKYHISCLSGCHSCTYPLSEELLPPLPRSSILGVRIFGTVSNCVIIFFYLNSASLSSTQAICYEFAVEMTYPLPEGVSAGLINFVSQVYYIISFFVSKGDTDIYIGFEYWNDFLCRSCEWEPKACLLGSLDHFRYYWTGSFDCRSVTCHTFPIAIASSMVA